MRLSEIARFVDHVGAMTSFYTKLLGKPPVHEGEGIAIFEQNGVSLLLHRVYTLGPGELPCEDHIAFAVKNLEQAISELETQGLQVEISPRDYDWGRSAYLRDPSGRLVEISEES